MVRELAAVENTDRDTAMARMSQSLASKKAVAA
jgi:hypothetical protein